jgi:hypothetical protein
MRLFELLGLPAIGISWPTATATRWRCRMRLYKVPRGTLGHEGHQIDKRNHGLPADHAHRDGEGPELVQVVTGLRLEADCSTSLNERYVKPSWELQLDELFGRHSFECSH